MQASGKPATVALAHRAIEQSKFEVLYGTRDLSRLKAEIQNLQAQINGSRKVIAETRAFLERLEPQAPRIHSPKIY